MRRPRHLALALALAATVALALTCAGCGVRHGRLTTEDRSALPAEDRAVLATDLALTRPAGTGAAFRPPAVSPAVATGRRVGPMRCGRRQTVRYGAHVELFARERGVVVPAGIGIALLGRCAYPLRTVDPSGVIVVGGSARRPTLGDLFALWGQPLSRARLGGFSGRVLAFLNGRRWRGDPRDIALVRHAQIVLEVGSRVPPHAAYLFPHRL